MTGITEPRFFGIGWHRTGTTTLTEAFNLLGFRGIHHPYKMYPEYRALAMRYKALEGCDFASDSIIPMVFDEIDVAYPGAKFILTRRDTESWLKSVQMHFELGTRKRPELNGQSIWDMNNEARFVHAIHGMQYRNPKVFDRDEFAAVYQAHNAHVLSHFKDRPTDLLIMDIGTLSFGWDSLCAFVGMPVPGNTPFPHARKSDEAVSRYYTPPRRQAVPA